MQNVGAYGVEVADRMTRVRLLDRGTGEVSWEPASRLGFGYRHSVLKGRSQRTVLEVEFALDRGRTLRAAALRRTGRRAGRSGGRADRPGRGAHAVLALRATKGMVLDEGDHDTWSVGSFFTNPVVDAGHFDRIRDSAGGPVPNYRPPTGETRRRLAG